MLYELQFSISLLALSSPINAFLVLPFPEERQHLVKCSVRITDSGPRNHHAQDKNLQVKNICHLLYSAFLVSHRQLKPETQNVSLFVTHCLEGGKWGIFWSVQIWPRNFILSEDRVLQKHAIYLFLPAEGLPVALLWDV